MLSKTDIRCAPSRKPPLKTEEVPQFVVFGSDDNGISGLPESGKKGGLQFILELFSASNPTGRNNPATYDGQKTSITLYVSTIYASSDFSDRAELVRKQWLAFLAEGHELGCHAHSHLHGEPMSLEEWEQELARFFEIIEAPLGKGGLGLNRLSLAGFRTPFLEYNRNTFEAISQAGFCYDCSLEEGFGDNEDGRNFYWPSTLDYPSPGNQLLYAGNQNKEIGLYPGLWEIPAYTYLVPPRELCKAYGMEPEIWDRLLAVNPQFKGKITGFDWNLWIYYKLGKAEFVGILKYSLDQRLAGNRCPFTVGIHSDIYSEAYDELLHSDPARPVADYNERMEALREFYEYALSIPLVRIVSAEKLVKWLSNPVSL